VVAVSFKNSSFILGDAVSEFETDFASKCNVKHCISTANGTDSIYIILKSLGIGLGDEVITVANSWISSSETISQTGAKPVFVDIDPEYYSINENLIKEKITKKTKAIIIVHLQGQMCNMNEILKIVESNNIFLIEDCAQSHFSEFNNKKAGTFGIAGSFSFYPGKNLGAFGDAGAIISNDNEFAKKCKMFARHGALVKHEHVIEGINSRMDGIQANTLNVKLKYILKWTDERIKVAEFYSENLKSVSQISLPLIRKNTKHSFHLYVIRVKKRKELIEFLKKHGIQTAIHYPTPLPFLKAYNYLNYKKEDFPVSHDYQNKILSLPIYPELSLNKINFVCEKIKEFYEI
jgi:dTDP-4-amino-4,6-dideoxygalactose transaminase